MKLRIKWLFLACAFFTQGGCCYFRDTCSPGYDPYLVNGATVAPISAWLDNHEAEWAGTGYRIHGLVSQTPLFRYMINRADGPGVRQNVSLIVFRECDGQWPDVPDYVIQASASDHSDLGLSPRKTYRLGASDDGLCISDGVGQDLGAMVLDADARYLMKLMVNGDRSESMRIEFRTQ